MIDAMPPANLEAEMCVLGSMLLDNATIDDIAILLRPDDFYRDTHEGLYRAILGLHGEGVPVDVITLVEHLQKIGSFEQLGGDRLIRDVLEAPPHSANAIYYASIVRQKAVARRLIEKAHATLRDCYSNNFTADELGARAEAGVREAMGDRDTGEATESERATDDAMALIERRIHGEITGIGSGLDDIDGFTGGFQPGSLTILGARPSMGKTALALNIADHVAVKLLVTPMIVSLEMAGPELALRMISSRSEVDGYRIRNAYLLNPAEKVHIAGAAAALRAYSFPLDDGSACTMPQIAAKVRRLKARRGIGLLIVDYLQLIEGRGSSRQEEISAISRRLKQLAIELQIPILALSQLNRQSETREDRRPRMSDLRESGAIEQDADVVMLLHRPEYYDPEDEPGIAELNIAKNRNGATGVVKLVFRKSIAKFESLSRERA